MSFCVLQLQGELSLETGEISDDVVDLVEHVWQEAVGELSGILAVPIESIKMEQVTAVLSDTKYSSTCFERPLKFILEMTVNDRWPYKGVVKEM